MALILVLVVLGTGIVAAMEAKSVGMTSDKTKGTYSSTSWFFIISLLWVVGYPAYLFKRRQFGLKNRLVPGLAVAIVFMGSWLLMNTAIEDQKAEVRAELNQLQTDLESFGN